MTLNPLVCGHCGEPLSNITIGDRVYLAREHVCNGRGYPPELVEALRAGRSDNLKLPEGDQKP